MADVNLKKKTSKKLLAIPIATAIFSIILYITLNFHFLNPTSEKYVDFLDHVNNNQVKKVYITNSSNIKVELNDNKIYTTDNPRNEDFKEFLLQNGIDVDESSNKPLSQTLPIVGLIASIAAIIAMIMKNSKRRPRGIFSGSHIEAEAIENVTFTFDDVAGNEEAKESVKDLVDFLKNPEKYSKYGARMPKGVILYGEPGTGKTLLAKAVAGEADVPFYAVSGSDFMQMYVGVGAGRIRSLFKKARSHGKAVIFIDEIDAIGKKRSSQNSNGSSDEKDQTLNALLTEMSGFNEKEGIVVIAATNRLDILDDALLRPGRFDRHIEVSLPDIKAREKILNLYLKDKPTNKISTHGWAQKTAYFSGAKLESLINEAAIIACKNNKEYIDDYDLDKAYSIVLAGHEKVNRDHIKERDKEITAYHEAGHAIVSLKLLPEEKVSKITIIPSTKGAGGYTLTIPEDKLHQNKKYLQDRMMVLLGGRAAEEIIYGKNKITTGAYNDLQKVTNISATMITQYGMGESLGLLNMEELSKYGISNQNEVMKECKSLIDELYNDTVKLLQENKCLLEKMTTLLIEEETLYHEDIEKLL